MTLKKEIVRDSLVSATLKLMDEGGLERVKARTVADRVGVSVGTIYNFFGNVDGLLREANSQIFADLNAMGMASMAEIETALRNNTQSGPGGENGSDRVKYGLNKLAATYIAFIDKNAARWAAVLAFNRRQAAEEQAQWYRDQQTALIDIIARVLVATSLGADDEKRAVAAHTLWSAVHGIVTMNYIGRATPEAKQTTWAQIDCLIELFVDGLFADNTTG
jgi:AcrR family transcriptional regulator